MWLKVVGIIEANRRIVVDSAEDVRDIDGLTADTIDQSPTLLCVDLSCVHDETRSSMMYAVDESVIDSRVGREDI